MQRNRKSIKITPRSYNLNGIPTRYFNPGELERLLHLYEMVPEIETIVEFGVNNGRNPLATFKNIPTVKQYVGVDVTQDYVTRMPVQRNEIPSRPGELVLGDPRFKLIVQPNGTFDLSAGDLPNADAVFIDADHSEVGVMHDYELAKKIIKPGGIIIFHDDNCLPVVQVTQTLNKICEQGREIVHIDGTWLSFETFSA